MKKTTYLFIAILLFGCSDSEPVRLAGIQKSYIGVWQYTDPDNTAETKMNNMLLVINPDSSAIYSRCIKDTKTENGGSSSSYSKSVTLPKAILTALEHDRFVLEQGLGLFSFDLEFEINKMPYLEGEEWYLVVDGIKLRKLNENEYGTTNWKCPDSADGEAI